jgi:hypothetical protein
MDREAVGQRSSWTDKQVDRYTDGQITDGQVNRLIVKTDG